MTSDRRGGGFRQWATLGTTRLSLLGATEKEPAGMPAGVEASGGVDVPMWASMCLMYPKYCTRVRGLESG